MKWILTISLITLSFVTFSKRIQEKQKEDSGYQLLLPTQDSTLSFIVHQNKLGLYNNLKNKELLLLDSIHVIKISPINAYKYNVDCLVENDSGTLGISASFTTSKDKNMEISIVKNQSENKDYTYSHSGYYYENNVRRIDDDKIIHNLSIIEPSAIDDGLRIVQRSGVYSLKERQFVLSPKHIKIEPYRSPSYDKHGPLFFKSMAINEDEQVHEMDYFDEEGDLYSLPNDNLRYGLYSIDLQEIIYPTSTNIYPMQFGGFNKGDGTGELYDYNGHKLAPENISGLNYSDVFISKNYIIVKHHNHEESDDLIDEEVYSFYTWNGQFVLTRSMEISEFLELPERALGIVTSYDEEFEYIKYNGVFDFDLDRLVIPDSYDTINVLNTDGDYYFSCQKNGKMVYFDKSFKIFNPASK